MEELIIGEIYQHYKGKDKLYRLILEIKSTEQIDSHTGKPEEWVVYQQLYDSPKFPKGTFWGRPKKMFLENIAVDVGGKKIEVPRFKLLRGLERATALEKFIHFD